MSEYEFNKRENKQISAFAQQILRFCYLMVAVALVAIVNGFNLSAQDGSNVMNYGLILTGILQIVLAYALYRPISNLNNVVTTKGNDISELMTGFTKLHGGFGIMMWLIILNLIVTIVQIASA